MLALHNAHSRRTPAVLPALLLVLLSLTLLVSCTDGAPNQAAQTPLSSTSAALPDPVGTPHVYSPRPASSVQAGDFAANDPITTPTSSVDPALPTATPPPTNTLRPTSTPFPPAPPLTNPVPDLHQAGVQYFPQTGHTLRGVFLDYWNKHGGLPQFGYPVTEEFVEGEGADNKPLQVQYFERNRFELHPEHKGTPDEVQLGLLGTQVATQKGYFAGSYPRYGHALDFSWIAGQLTEHWQPGAGSPIDGCSIVTYSKPAMQVQLEGEIWRAAEEEARFGRQISFPGGAFLQISGHLASSNERGQLCGAYAPEVTPVYIVTRVQINAFQ